MNDNDIALLRRVRPVDPPQDDAAKARAWARLHAEFDAAPTAGPVRTLRRRMAWRLAATGVVAAGAAVAIVAVQLGGSAPKPPPAGGDSTVHTLELAAQTVERQTVTRPGPNQWIYSPEVRNWAIAPGNTIGTLRGKIRVDQWWRFDGRRIAESTQGSKITVSGILLPGEKLHPGHVVAGVDGGWESGPAVWRSSPRGLYDYVAKLPADPDALLAKIRKDARGGKGDAPAGDDSAFGKIAQILDDDKLIPPKTNAALYRALEKIPGVTVVRGVKDITGRSGIAVTRTGHDTRVQIILDRTTYRYLGWRTTATQEERAGKTVIAHAGQVTNDTADLGAHVVDQPGQRG